MIHRFLPHDHVCLVNRLGIRAPERLGASEWGFRNANKFIQPPPFEVGGTLAKLPEPASLKQATCSSWRVLFRLCWPPELFGGPVGLRALK